MTRDYELAFILNPEVSEEQTRAILDRINQIVATYGGQVVKVNQWGRRRLAYPIERNRDGIYVFIDMILATRTIPELERTLKVSEEVLRHMLKRRDPKAAQKERLEREEREARAAATAAAQEAAAQQNAAVAVAEPVPVTEVAPETEVAPVAEVTPETESAVPVSEEEEAPAALPVDTMELAPPAIEEDGIEAQA
ncbi:MAG: 30S ribosomal protein S6 [Ktedonobacteraceae bacterium]|nr:30S ribosomal protein S6 [Ktedonobacteraceae bacterium]